MKQFKNLESMKGKTKRIPWVAVQLLKWCKPAEPHSRNRYNFHTQNIHFGQSADPPLKREKEKNKWMDDQYWPTD